MGLYSTQMQGLKATAATAATTSRDTHFSSSSESISIVKIPHFRVILFLQRKFSSLFELHFFFLVFWDWCHAPTCYFLEQSSVSEHGWVSAKQNLFCRGQFGIKSFIGGGLSRRRRNRGAGNWFQTPPPVLFPIVWHFLMKCFIGEDMKVPW